MTIDKPGAIAILRLVGALRERVRVKLEFDTRSTAPELREEAAAAGERLDFVALDAMTAARNAIAQLDVVGAKLRDLAPDVAGECEGVARLLQYALEKLEGDVAELAAMAEMKPVAEPRPPLLGGFLAGSGVGDLLRATEPRPPVFVETDPVADRRFEERAAAPVSAAPTPPAGPASDVDVANVFADIADAWRAAPLPRPRASATPLLDGIPSVLPEGELF